MHGKYLLSFVMEVLRSVVFVCWLVCLFVNIRRLLTVRSSWRAGTGLYDWRTGGGCALSIPFVVNLVVVVVVVVITINVKKTAV